MTDTDRLAALLHDVSMEAYGQKRWAQAPWPTDMYDWIAARLIASGVTVEDGTTRTVLPSTLAPRPFDLGPLVDDGCPACHHPDHDPGSCHWCPRCELHTDDALAWVLRIEPEIVRPAPDAALTPDRLAAAMNDAQIGSTEIALGRDLRAVAVRILAALEAGHG